MKKYYLLSAFILASLTLFSQTDAISYQAVILNPKTQEIPGVDAESNILPNKVIAMRFTILRLNGTIDYQETQLPMTDAYGLVNLFIGEGTQTSANDFDEIEWDGEPKNLQVEIDFNAGANFTELDTQKLSYVPYSHHRNITASGNLTVDGESLLQSNLQVLENTNLEGDLTVEGVVQFNNDFNITGDTNFDGDLVVNGTTDLNDYLHVVGITNLDDALNVDGTVQFNNDFNVTGSTTGEGNLTINGTTDLNENLNVAGVTNLNNTLNVVGGVILENTLAVNDVVNLNNTLTVTGTTTLEDDLEVEGDAVLANLIVKGNGEINGKHIALFENNSPDDRADGIAIRIDKGELSMQNNFITFYREGNNVAGRIESFDLSNGDTFASFPVPDFASMIDVFDFDNVLQGGELPSISYHDGHLGDVFDFHKGSLPSLTVDADWGGANFDWDPGSLPYIHFHTQELGNVIDLDAGSFPSLNFDGFFDPQAGVNAINQITPMVGWADDIGALGLLTLSPWDIALNTVVISALENEKDQGVIYGSKGADYAEWLEKENPNEKFVYGVVVGVKNGKISKVTEGADQVMSISRNPIVLGNMPNDGEETKSEKVGFLGQVPVLVIGDVVVGDYIVATGNNDGYAKAINPENFKIENVKNLIGKAWSSSDGKKLSYINVSVGLNNNEWVSIVKMQEERLNRLDEKVKKLQNLIERVEKLESQNLY